ncbi:membrane protein [Salmonella enterica subsp. indica]|uniref:Membrane protein n=1 Tax=Salmonella enterica subsp. indica TaxID=59207 RepID=A0A379XP62_SALER|nr:membrane protein [Salmonella enterica subsp. indica]
MVNIPFIGINIANILSGIKGQISYNLICHIDREYNVVDDKPMKIGWVFYFSYIFVAIIFHLFMSLCYCLSLDMAEAHAVVFLLEPGTISLLFLLLPARRFRTRLWATLSSILITLGFNQWHLVAGNKELVLCLQAACFTAFLAMTSVKKYGWIISASLFLVCAAGVIRQCWLEQTFNAADIYIVDDGRGCGASGHCFQSIAAKGRGLAAKRQALFSSEEYVNIYYSYPEGIPAVNFDGMKNEFAQYLLCHGELKSVECESKITCD